MIKALAKQIKEYKSASLVTPIFMILEVAMEMVIPLLMASIIDDGVQAGDMKHIDRKSTRLNSSHTRPSRMPSSA